MGINNSDFTSASTFPIKLFHNPIIQDGKIIPYHLTITPTNVCDEECPECFCRNRDKTKSISFENFKKIVDEFYSLGTRAISLSGGGEPDCHPQINDMINFTKSYPLDVALVSNGRGLHRITTENLNKLTWVRVSGTSSRPINLEKLAENVNRGSEVDWSLSFVVGNYNHKPLVNLIDFANSHNKVTHVRVVSDMMYPDVNLLPHAKNYVDSRNVDDSKVIWQERTENVQGRKDCKFYLLHPVVSADENVQACCGIHFATNPPTYDFNDKTAVCHWTEYKDLLQKQKVFDGTKCEVCQYDDYNKTLNMLLTKPKHEKFV